MGMHSLLRRWPVAAAAVLIASTGLLAMAAPGPYALSDLGDPPSDSPAPVQIYALNNSGVVAGEFRTSTDRRASSPFVSVGGEIHSLGTPLGRVHAGARGVNDLGQVVGLTNEADLDGRAFMWQQGSGHLDLGTLGGNLSHAMAINNAGTVVGMSTTPSWDGHAFAYYGGVMHDIHQLGLGSEALAISPNGTIVGNWLGADLNGYAFIYRDGVMHDLDPMHIAVYANGVNDAGQVVGQGPIPGLGEFPDHHAVLWQDGVMHDLGTFGGRSSNATSINAIGHVVGQATDTGEASHPFIYAEGQLWALAPLVTQGGKGWQLYSAIAINDRGQIVGMGRHNHSRPRPFLLTPLAAR